MVVKSKPYYWIECDECGASSGEIGDFAAWSDSGAAIDEAVSAEWFIGDDGEHKCYSCAPKCAECGYVLDSDRTCSSSVDHEPTE